MTFIRFGSPNRWLNSNSIRQIHINEDNPCNVEIIMYSGTIKTTHTEYCTNPQEASDRLAFILASLNTMPPDMIYSPLTPLWPKLPVETCTTDNTNGKILKTNGNGEMGFEDPTEEDLLKMRLMQENQE